MNLVDKNKSAHKLEGIGPIYCINLDDQPDRWEYMETQFKYWEIEDKVTRISAYDGRDDDLGHLLKGTYPVNMTSGEVGCSLSHLKALRHYLITLIVPMQSLWKMIVVWMLSNSGTLNGKNSILGSHMIGMYVRLPLFVLVTFM